MGTELHKYGKTSNINSEYSSQMQLSSPVQSTEELFKPTSRCRGNRKMIILFAILILVAGVGGFLLGYFLSKPSTSADGSTREPPTQDQNYYQKFQDMVDPEELEKNLRLFTSRLHVATSPAADSIADYLRTKWQEHGFEIEEPEYDVLLSFPQEDKPNTVSIINNNTKAVELKITGQFNVTAGLDSNVSYVYTPYLAYAPNATVEGQLVYVNHGASWDFAELDKRNISAKGKILIMGSLFGNIKAAETRGALGVILYPDPKIYAPEGHGLNDTYPNTPWLPPNAVHRTSLSPFFGDAFTPLLPSTRGMYRISKDKLRLPSIPVQAISYEQGADILRRMGGEKVPDKMRGDLDLDYRFGPGFNDTSSNSIVRLEVNNQLITKKVRNVVATIRGSHEPDRYVLIGNHRDAWSFGGADPSSGTATLAEISRVLSGLLKQGWRPRRTIKLYSWGGEEFALIGSNEYVEENDQIIRERVVAYLNTDVAVGGDFVLFAQISSMLSELVLTHAKKVQDPKDSKKTLYDTMLKRLPRSTDYPSEPMLYSFWYSTDNLPFCLYSGISTGDFSFFYGYKNRRRLYPVYHSQYDTFDWIKKFIDPEFRHFKAMTQFLGSMLLDLSDSKVLPFSVKRFGKSVQNAHDSLSMYNFTFEKSQVFLDELTRATNEFVNATKDFETAKQKLDSQQNPLVLRMLNDQMANLEKCFVSPYSNADWRPYRTLIFKERFLHIDSKMQQSDPSKTQDSVKYEISLAIQAIRAATRLLQP